MKNVGILRHTVSLIASIVLMTTVGTDAAWAQAPKPKNDTRAGILSLPPYLRENDTTTSMVYELVSARSVILSALKSLERSGIVLEPMGIASGNELMLRNTRGNDLRLYSLLATGDLYVEVPKQSHPDYLIHLTPYTFDNPRLLNPKYARRWEAKGEAITSITVGPTLQFLPNLRIAYLVSSTYPGDLKGNSSLVRRSEIASTKEFQVIPLKLGVAPKGIRVRSSGDEAILSKLVELQQQTSGGFNSSNKFGAASVWHKREQGKQPRAGIINPGKCANDRIGVGPDLWAELATAMDNGSDALNRKYGNCAEKAGYLANLIFSHDWGTACGSIKFRQEYSNEKTHSWLLVSVNGREFIFDPWDGIGGALNDFPQDSPHRKKKQYTQWYQPSCSKTRPPSPCCGDGVKSIGPPTWLDEECDHAGTGFAKECPQGKVCQEPCKCVVPTPTVTPTPTQTPTVTPTPTITPTPTPTPVFKRCECPYESDPAQGINIRNNTCVKSAIKDIKMCEGSTCEVQKGATAPWDSVQCSVISDDSSSSSSVSSSSSESSTSTSTSSHISSTSSESSPPMSSTHNSSEQSSTEASSASSFWQSTESSSLSVSTSAPNLSNSSRSTQMSWGSSYSTNFSIIFQTSSDYWTISSPVSSNVGSTESSATSSESSSSSSFLGSSMSSSIVSSTDTFYTE